LTQKIVDTIYIELMTEYKGYRTVKTESGETLYGHLSNSDAGDLAYFSKDRKMDKINHACLGQILGLYKNND
jgi:hypothetical protein